MNDRTDRKLSVGDNIASDIVCNDSCQVSRDTSEVTTRTHERHSIGVCSLPLIDQMDVAERYIARSHQLVFVVPIGTDK